MPQTQTNPKAEELRRIISEELLYQVQKPGQYLGNEYGATQKDWDSAKSRMALIYPDLYELGMSNYGLKVLYNIVNSHPDFLCDRAYAPMQDMEALLKERNLPLWAWESFRPLQDFDMLGFSFGYELCYTNVLTMLDLAQIPQRAAERGENDPLIFAGGPATHNPEPMADFIDFFLIGDGEDVIVEIQESMLRSRAAGKSRADILLDLAQIQGVYVPRFYQPDPQENFLPKPIEIASASPRNDKGDDSHGEHEGRPKPFHQWSRSSSKQRSSETISIPNRVKKRVAELGDYNQATSGPVPHIGVVQDKQVLEIRRGCDRGCRFCQVGYTYLPVRERSPEELWQQSLKSKEQSGYDSYTLLSLSASDYTCLTEAAKAINNTHAEDGISLSMPSQRADRFDVELADEVNQVRKSGMTFAPEAGSEKMRRIINKGLSQEEIQKAIRGSYEKGWSHIKLYFMIGLPFEEDSDLDGILDTLTWSINMAKQIQREEREAIKAERERELELNKDIPDYKAKHVPHKKDISITCTISTFVPKTFTAFQCFSQCSQEEFARKHQYLRDGIKERRIDRFIKLNCTEPKIALLESVLSRGDRRWGQVIEEVWKQGGRLDSWSEHFNVDRWQAAAEKFGLDLETEASKPRDIRSKHCWDVLDLGFTDKFFVDEWEQATQAAETSPCTENKCHACGVCFNLDVKNIVTTNRSDANPFVTEIDIEKRKAACANFDKLVEGQHKEINEQRSLKNQPKVIVKHTEAKQKLRLVFTKLGDYRFVSHLDFQRLIEKALRRSGLPVVHTLGFNQRIKLSWGNPVPLFTASEWEYLEIELAEVWEDLENLKEILNAQLPNQARIRSVELVLASDRTNISQVHKANYQAKLITNPKNHPINQEVMTNFLAQEKIEIQKLSKAKKGKRAKTKLKNIREHILGMKVLATGDIELELKSTQRVDEVLNSMAPESRWEITKTHQELV